MICGTFWVFFFGQVPSKVMWTNGPLTQKPYFVDRFDHYCLMSINCFFRNAGRGSQKQTFTRRQWAQYFLFLFFTQHLFQSFWSLLFDVNQLLSQKWRSKLSKANFCSKTVSTILANFALHSTSFPIILIIIFWCE